MNQEQLFGGHYPDLLFHRRPVARNASGSRHEAERAPGSRYEAERAPAIKMVAIKEYHAARAA